MKQRALVTALILVPLLIIDQLTKWLAVKHLMGASEMSYFGGLAKLTYAENKGAFLSFGASFPDAWRFPLFTLAVGLFLIYLGYFILRHPLTRFQLCAYSLLLGGGIGNLIDRILYQYVIDFLWMGYGVIKTGVFNVADMAIMAGVLALFYESIAQAIKHKRNPKLQLDKP